MNRRHFLRALIGAAAAPVMAKLADPFKGPAFLDSADTAWVASADGEWTVIDLRAAAMATMVAWMDREVDRLLYASMSQPRLGA